MENFLQEKTKTREWKITCEGYYKKRDNKYPSRLVHMFSRLLGVDNKAYAHVSHNTLKADCNIAINQSLRQLENGGYMTVEIKMVNP